MERVGESLKSTNDYQNLKNVDDEVQALFARFDLRSHDLNQKQHTNAGTQDSEEEFDDIQVIENTSTTPPIEEEEEEEDEQYPEPDSPPKAPHDVIEVHENHGVPAKETNGIKQGNNNNFDHETYYLSKPSRPTEKVDVSMMTSTARATKYSRPLLPKVLVALLVILVLAVIALAFVLYHLDQDISANKNKALRMGWDMQEAGEEIKKLQKSVGNETFIQLQKELNTLRSRLDKKTDKTNMTLLELRANYNRDVKELRQTNNKSNEKMKKLEREFQADVKRLSNQSRELNITLQQLDMFIEFNDRYKGRIGLTFDQVVELSNEPNRVDKDISHLQLLEYQFKKFQESNKTWGIKYEEIIRLTDAVDFELNQEIPLLQKIGSMYDLFHRKYASVWQITFEDVLRLTTKQDVADMTVQEWKALAANVNGSTPLLNKINYMFKKFNSTYRYKWKYVPFKDVISLVEKIDFKIGDDIPILTKIDKLHFDGFEDYWGEGFVGLVRLVLKNGLDGTEIVTKLKDISSSGKYVFKFVPGIFERSPEGQWSVHGVVGIYNRTDITDNLRAIYGDKVNVDDKVAKVLCMSQQYKRGEYNRGAYNKGTAKGLEKYYSFIWCVTGTEDSIDACQVRTGTTWDDEDDAGFKCFL